jgi:hypothetical protein
LLRRRSGGFAGNTPWHSTTCGQKSLIDDRKHIIYDSD